MAISDHVIDQVETATGLAATDQPTPAGGIVRAAGPDRFATAAAVADLLAAYDPAYLPVTAQAVDADTLDGKHASAFVEEGDPIDAETLDGTDGSDFARGLFAVVDSDGTVRAGSHLTTTGNVHVSDGWYVLEFDQDVTYCAVTASFGSRSGTSSLNSRIISVTKAVGNPSVDPGTVGVQIERFQSGVPGFTAEDAPFDVAVMC